VERTRDHPLVGTAFGPRRTQMASKRRTTKKEPGASDTTAYGERLKAARVARKLSQPALAAKSGVGTLTIWRAEKSGRVTEWLASRLAPVLGVEAGSLISIHAKK
jgi:ribosome-binding protein aMBF1 (putative translation factor)